MLTVEGIKIIEDALGIQGLTEAIASQEPVELKPTKVKHFNQASYDALYDNLTKQGLTVEKYEEAKAAGEEMAVKKIKRDKNYEFEGKTVEGLHEFLVKQIEKSKTTDIEKLKTDYESDLTKLRDSLAKKDKEIEDMKISVENERISYAIDSKFDSLEIDVPESIKDEQERIRFIETEKAKNKIHFKSIYQFKSGENKQIVTLQNGNVLKDETLSPLPIDKVFEGYVASNFIKIKKQQNGRGAGDNNTQGITSNFKSIDELREYANKKGIKPNTAEFDAIYNDWSSKNKK